MNAENLSLPVVGFTLSDAHRDPGREPKIFPFPHSLQGLGCLSQLKHENKHESVNEETASEGATVERGKRQERVDRDETGN